MECECNTFKNFKLKTITHLSFIVCFRSMVMKYLWKRPHFKQCLVMALMDGIKSFDKEIPSND